LLRDKYESWRYAPKITAPTTILAAEFDQVVPRESTEALRSRFRGGLVRYTVLPRTNHVSISNRPEYWELLKAAP
jgi:pimeloyl-ACP methyl ester carboxylesterase